MTDESLTRQQALELLRAHNVYGSGENIQRLIDACERQPSLLEAIAIALRDLKGGDASLLDDPDILELVLKHLVHSGNPQLALKAYHKNRHFRDSSGGYKNLGRKRGRFEQGLKLASVLGEAIEVFSGDDSLARDPETGFPSVAHDQALFLIELGELAEAEAILRSPTISQVDGYYPGVEGQSLYQFPARLNLCDILILKGRLSEANYVIETMIKAFESNDVGDSHGYTQAERLIKRVKIGEYVGSYSFTTGFNPYAHRALIRTLQGQVDKALLDFKQAEDFQRKKLDKLYETRKQISQLLHYKRIGQEPPKEVADDSRSEPPPSMTGQAALFYGLLLTRLGKLQTARQVLDYNRRWAAHSDNHFPGMIAFADVALSDVLRLQGDSAAAERQLEHPLSWSAETGQKEIACWAHLSLARAHLARRELDKTQRALDMALSTAMTHNFALYEIDCRITAGRIALVNRDWGTARENTIKALYAAADPECSYTWAHGNTLHLLAEILSHPSYEPEYAGFNRGNILQDAERLAKGAVQIRERIRDPRLANSQELLAKITTQIGA